jgi:hypothetical protein
MNRCRPGVAALENDDVVRPMSPLATSCGALWRGRSLVPRSVVIDLCQQHLPSRFDHDPAPGEVTERVGGHLEHKCTSRRRERDREGETN